MPAVQRILFTDGSEFEPHELTVAIGPNNGGKSRFLREISQAVIQPQLQRKAISEVKADPTLVRKLVIELASQADSVDENGNYVFDTIQADLTKPQQSRPDRARIQALLDQPDLDDAIPELTSTVSRHLIAHLTTEHRLALVKRQVNKDVNLRGVQSPMHAAFDANPATLREINRYVKKAFRQALVVDKVDFAAMEFRLVPTGQSMPDDRNRAAISTLERLDDQGDGIRAFCGVLIAVAMVDRPIVLVDEPEAFLHPPQAFLLGQALAALRGRGHQFFVATHSSDVLRGILSQSTEVDVIRFARKRGRFRRKTLDAAELVAISSDPVLSSSRVLDGLFYEGVIISESDGDVILYRRILEQLVKDGVFHFVNSYGKQNSSRMARPYQAMEVPHATIVDFDMLRVPEELRALVVASGITWIELEPEYQGLIDAIEAADRPPVRRQRVLRELDAIRANLAGAADPRAGLEEARRRFSGIRESASVWKDLKRQGARALSQQGQGHFATVDSKLRRAGIFIVPVGEREAWLPAEAPYSKNKSRWTTAALTALQVRLTQGHPLRDFMQNVSAYLRSR